MFIDRCRSIHLHQYSTDENHQERKRRETRVEQVKHIRRCEFRLDEKSVSRRVK